MRLIYFLWSKIFKEMNSLLHKVWTHQKCSSTCHKHQKWEKCLPTQEIFKVSQNVKLFSTKYLYCTALRALFFCSLTPANSTLSSLRASWRLARFLSLFKSSLILPLWEHYFSVPWPQQTRPWVHWEHPEDWQGFSVCSRAHWSYLFESTIFLFPDPGKLDLEFVEGVLKVGKISEFVL